MAASKEDVLRYYRDRLRTHQLSLKQLLRRMRFIRYTRAASGLCIAAVLWSAFAVQGVSAWLAFLPAAIYVALHWPHERFYERLTRTSGAITYYERGIARVEDRWVGTGIVDTTFVEPGHIYANDLDIFGEGSLFELLCTVRTRAGQETLARWLASPAARDQIIQRQQAVEELRNNVDLREDLSQSTPDGAVIDMASIDEWTSAPPIFPMPIARRVAPILVAFTICALGYSYFTKDTTFLTAPLVLQIGFAFFYRRRVSNIISTVREPAAEIGKQSLTRQG